MRTPISCSPFTVRIFDASFARSHANPKKIYCIDHALVTSVSSGLLVNAGHLLENLVFVALRRVYPQVFYHRTRTGKEVDFVVPTRRGARTLIQGCESLADSLTRKRETAAVNEAMTKLGLDSGTLVTRNQSDQIETRQGAITAVPIWRFLLDLPDSAAAGA